MLLYYITDRTQFSGNETERRAALLRSVAEAAAAGVDFIQLREKDLHPAELEQFARETLRALRGHSSCTKLLINSRTDIALAVGADGVHLTSSDIAASDARMILAASRHQRAFLVSVSCHSAEEVRRAESHGADFVVLGPIFEKSGMAIKPLGVDAIRAATLSQERDNRVEAGDNRHGIPVLALGGVDLANAQLCLKAGAAGIAGIRLFQAGNLKEVIEDLRVRSS